MRYKFLAFNILAALILSAPFLFYFTDAGQIVAMELRWHYYGNDKMAQLTQDIIIIPADRAEIFGREYRYLTEESGLFVQINLEIESHGDIAAARTTSDGILKQFNIPEPLINDSYINISSRSDDADERLAQSLHLYIWGYSDEAEAMAAAIKAAFESKGSGAKQTPRIP